VVNGVQNVVFGLDKVDKEQQQCVVEPAIDAGFVVCGREKGLRGGSCTEKCAPVWDGLVSPLDAMGWGWSLWIDHAGVVGLTDGLTGLG
jgi:hypothetical protein